MVFACRYYKATTKRMFDYTWTRLIQPSNLHPSWIGYVMRHCTWHRQAAHIIMFAFHVCVSRRAYRVSSVMSEEGSSNASRWRRPASWASSRSYYIDMPARQREASAANMNALHISWKSRKDTALGVAIASLASALEVIRVWSSAFEMDSKSSPLLQIARGCCLCG